MKVLVVVDMQNDFIDGTLGTPEAQAIVPKVVKKIEEFVLISVLSQTPCCSRHLCRKLRLRSMLPAALA